MLTGTLELSDSTAPRRLRISDLVRPHWKALTIAVVAVLGETLTDILQPWPIKIVVDNILQSKRMPAARGRRDRAFGDNAYAMSASPWQVWRSLQLARSAHTENADDKRQPVESGTTYAGPFTTIFSGSLAEHDEARSGL